MMRRLLLLSLFAGGCAVAQQQLQLKALPSGPTYEPGQGIDFGTVPVGTPNTVAFELINSGPGRLTLTRLAVDGAAFQLGRAPVEIAIAVGQSIEFTVTFTPQTAGPARLGELWVRTAGQPQAEYDLAGRGTRDATGAFVEPRAEAAPAAEAASTPTPAPAPVWPKATIEADPLLAINQQSTISIRFESALPADGAGTLTVEHTGGGDIQRGFVLWAPNGPLSPSEVSFSLFKGESVARFVGHPGIVFQTGTTASTLTFKAILGPLGDGLALASRSFEIAPAPAGIDRVLLNPVTTSANQIVVTVNGFDNSQTASAALYTFYDTANRQICPPISPAGTGEAFQSYFAHAGTSLFGLTQTFNVTGDVIAIGSVAVSIHYSQGDSATVTGTMQQ